MKAQFEILALGIPLIIAACGGSDTPTSTTNTATSTSSSTTSTTSTPPATTTSTVCRSTDVTETIPFSLPPAAERPTVRLGPFQNVGPGRVFGELRFTRGYVMCVCVGTEQACRPFCGPGPKVEFALNVPQDFPAGTFTAAIYYNTNFPQPAAGASGNFTISYRTYCP